MKVAPVPAKEEGRCGGLTRVHRASSVKNTPRPLRNLHAKSRTEPTPSAAFTGFTTIMKTRKPRASHSKTGLIGGFEKDTCLTSFQG